MENQCYDNQDDYDVNDDDDDIMLNNNVKVDKNKENKQQSQP